MLRYPIVGDWIAFTLSYSGAWPTSANSQIDNLPLLQLASVGGLSLIGALMALVAGNISCWLIPRLPKRIGGIGGIAQSLPSP